MPQDQEFLEYILKTIVDEPDHVRVERRVDELGVLLSVHVHPIDMGQVIGQKGQTTQAIRHLMRIVGIKTNARVNLKIEEPDGSERPQKSHEDHV